MNALPATTQPPIEQIVPSTADSTDPIFIKARARHAYETGRWDAAESYYLKLTGIQPDQADPWFQLGNLYVEQGRLDLAEHAYRQAIRRRDEARTLHNLGLVQIKLGIGALREARDRLPPSDPVHQQTGEFLHTLLKIWAR